MEAVVTVPAIALRNLSPDAQLIINYLDSKFYERIFQRVSVKDAEINDLRIEVTPLNTRLRKIGNSLDDSDVYERRDSIMISGDAIANGAPN